MSEYLTRDEIKQWRSSLEKMTLEEYAAKLGKVIKQEKETNDIVDKLNLTKSFSSMEIEEYRPKIEMIKSVAQRTILKERELVEKYNIRVKNLSSPVLKTHSKQTEQSIDNSKFVKKVIEEENNTVVEYSFKKALTPREKLVFSYFKEHKNEIIYAKNLAELLGLPRDYIYKYIKTLRNKSESDCIVNAENGGFILK